MELSDVETAFLETNLKETIYVEHTHGFVEGRGVCRLSKALYGLKQNVREWYATLREGLLSLGFARVWEGYSDFTSSKTIITTHVDEILFIAPKLEFIQRLKSELSRRFRFKHLGEVKLYLGMTVTRD